MNVIVCFPIGMDILAIQSHPSCWMIMKSFLMKISGAEAKWHFTWKLVIQPKWSWRTHLNHTTKNHLTKQCMYHQPNKQRNKHYKIDFKFEHVFIFHLPFCVLRHFLAVIPILCHFIVSP